MKSCPWFGVTMLPCDSSLPLWTLQARISFNSSPLTWALSKILRSSPPSIFQVLCSSNDAVIIIAPISTFCKCHWRQPRTVDRVENSIHTWCPESNQAKLVSTLFLLHHQITLLVLLRARSKLQQLFWYTRLTFIFSVKKIDKVKYCYTNVLNRTRLSFLPYLLLLYFLWNSTWLSLLISAVFVLRIYDSGLAV